MKKIKFIILLLSITILSVINCDRGKNQMICNINSIEDLKNLFPKSVNEIKQNTEKTKEIISISVNEITSVPKESKSFKNTAKAFDNLMLKANTLLSPIQTLEMVSSEKDIRDAAHEATLEISNFLVQEVSTNKKLYEAFKAYYDNQFKEEGLDKEEKYFVEETIKDFERHGLNLPDEKLSQLKKILEEINKLTLEFQKNINSDNSSIEVDLKELKGLPENLIATFEKAPNGKYILKADYPTVFGILEHGEVQSTREKIYKLKNNKAFPQNLEVLKDLVKKRNELAKLLSFKSFTELDLDDQMAKNPKTVKTFIKNLVEKAKIKAKKEIQLFSENTSDKNLFDSKGKIKPWNTSFIKSEYKKNKLNLDTKKIAEYFPLENTIKELLDIYEQFLNVTFKSVSTNGFWHEDVKLIEVIKDNQLIGYLLLDLHPRDNKYGHACDMPVIPAVKKDNKICPAVSVVIANFAKSTKDNPSLLPLSEVTTFFHEFGHAMHDMLGRTKIASFAGTSVKRDFVELPSQMLENWMKNKDILKKVSKHYKTGEPLSDETIEKIVDLEKLDSGDFTLRQLSFATQALELFSEDIPNDLLAFVKKIDSNLRDYISWDPDSDHFIASFGHLTGYGAKYYGYMWSNVFAHDLFEKIQKNGLLNGKMGQEYVNKVIGKGGSQDPNELLEDFLGRKPNEEAFIKNMGFGS